MVEPAKLSIQKYKNKVKWATDGKSMEDIKQKYSQQLSQLDKACIKIEYSNLPKYLIHAFKCITCSICVREKIIENDRLHIKKITEFTQKDSTFDKLDLSILQKHLENKYQIYKKDKNNDIFTAILTILNQITLINKKNSHIEEDINYNYLILAKSDAICNFIKSKIFYYLDSLFVEDAFVNISVNSFKCKCKRYQKCFSTKCGITLKVANHITLEECLEIYFRPKEKPNLCKYCKNKPTESKFPIYFAPIQIFQLQHKDKQSTSFKYPIDNEPLDLMKYIPDFIKSKYWPNTQHLNYYLAAVGVCIGNIKHGSYYSYIFNCAINKWEEHDDINVHEITPKNALNASAVTLVYMKEDLFTDLSLENYKWNKVLRPYTK